MAWTRSEPEQPVPAPQPNQPSYRENVPRQRATIGKSVHIKGDVTAKEDLVIEGTVEGRVVVTDHSLTIGPNSRVTNEIRAKSVVVGGEVQGNITAADRVEVSTTGSMLGDIAAPRVVLADGARFKGKIDMEPKAVMRAGSGSDKVVSAGEKPASQGLTKTA